MVKALTTAERLLIHAAGVAYLVGPMPAPHQPGCEGCNDVRTYVRKLGEPGEAGDVVICTRCFRKLRHVFMVGGLAYGRQCAKVVA